MTRSKNTRIIIPLLRDEAGETLPSVLSFPVPLGGGGVYDVLLHCTSNMFYLI